MHPRLVCTLLPTSRAVASALALLGLIVPLVACGGSDPVLVDRDGGPRSDGGVLDGGAPDGAVEDGGPPPPHCGEPVPPPPDALAGRWDARFLIPGVGGTAPAYVLALAPLADGRVFVGGQFSTAGPIPARNVAVWADGVGFRPLGAGLPASVSALAVDAAGVVYAAADASEFFGSTLHRFDGTTWSEIGRAEEGLVTDLAIAADGALLVGGWFSRIGGADLANFARYDGTAFDGAGATVDGAVSAIVSSGATLCIGGGFSRVGALDARNVACRTSGAWTARDLPLPFYSVDALAFDRTGALLAGGSFDLTTDDPEDGGGIARWDGTGWELLGGGVHSLPGAAGWVKSITVVGDQIFVGGAFSFVGHVSAGAPADGVAMWNGTAWSTLGGGLHKPVGFSLDVENVKASVALPSGNVIFGGLFSATDTVSVGYLAEWDGTALRRLVHPGQGPGGVAGIVNALAVEGTCGVYVGGDFSLAGDLAAENVARYSRARGWETVGGSLPEPVFSLLVVPPEDGAPEPRHERVIAGLASDDLGTFHHLAVYDGTNWRRLGEGVDGAVKVLARAPDGRVYVGGSFTSSGRSPLGHAAVLDGETLGPISGAGFDGDVHAIAFDDAGHAYFGGDFTHVSGVAANRVARWDGARWEAVGAGFDDSVLALAFHDGRLVAGGWFDGSLAAWDGSSWQTLGGGLPGVGANELLSLSGTLFVAGIFDDVASATGYRNLAAWNGASFVDVAGPNDVVEAFALGVDGLYVGGTFTGAGDVPAVGLALLTYD